jgi:hypothetical protein
MTSEAFLPDQFPYALCYRMAVGGNRNWHYACSVDGEGVLRGVLPYQLKKRWGLSFLTPPPLSPRLGPYLVYPANCVTIRQRQDFQFKVLTDLANNLPDVAYARIHWPYELNYGLPWQQLGWQQSVRYSYVLDLSLPMETIFAHFKSSLRNKIRKAERLLRVVETTDYQPVFRLTQLDFQHRGVANQISESLMARLDAAAASASARKIWLAKDENDRVHAAIWLLFDGQCAYNLFLGSDPELRSSGASTLVLWQAIQWSKQQGLSHFDFEGSQLPGIEAFFRSFGGQAQPYYQFTKIKKWLRPLFALRTI